MKKEFILLLAEDDDGHASLIERNLRRGGIVNEIIRFRDGDKILDFLFRNGELPHRQSGTQYLVLLDIRMPRVDGVEVLRKLKKDNELHKMPVIMISTIDDEDRIDECHALGCSTYLIKPINHDDFVRVIRRLGVFLNVVEVPRINGKHDE